MPTGTRRSLGPATEDSECRKPQSSTWTGRCWTRSISTRSPGTKRCSKFGHDVSFEQVRGQIGKGGDKLIPVFLSADEQRDHGKEMEEWRGNRFKTEYLPLVRPFSAVPDLLRRVRDAGLRIAVASSAKKDELDKYLDIARIADLVDVTTSSDDVEESKPAPDIFEIVLKKLKIEGADAVAIGDTPYDAEAAGKAKIATIGVLCGGFTESSLRQAGCVEVYPGPAALFACFGGLAARKVDVHGEKTEDLPDFAGLLRSGDRRSVDEGGSGSVGRRQQSLPPGRGEGERRSGRHRRDHGEAGRRSQAPRRIRRALRRACRTAHQSGRR